VWAIMMKCKKVELKRKKDSNLTTTDQTTEAVV
jgi:hypothetical protein